jgi:hypothetical protein
VARGKSGVGKNQKLDLERHPEKARATHRKMRAKDRPLAPRCQARSRLISPTDRIPALSPSSADGAVRPIRWRWSA